MIVLAEWRASVRLTEKFPQGILPPVLPGFIFLGLRVF